MLCDIYINMGENALCETCKRFPRITLDYSQFQEKILSLACPEALRLMLKNGAMDKIITADNREDAEPCDYDFSVMQLLLGARGQETEIRIVAENILKTRNKLNEILAANTGKSVEEISRDTERDNYMTAQEAVAYGLIDSVVEKR